MPHIYKFEKELKDDNMYTIANFDVAMQLTPIHIKVIKTRHLIG
jgi:hypothetical protein